MSQQVIDSKGACLIPNAKLPSARLPQPRTQSALHAYKDTSHTALLITTHAVPKHPPTPPPRKQAINSVLLSQTAHCPSHLSILPQLDGPYDFLPQKMPHALPYAPSKSAAPSITAQQLLPKSAYRDLLPYCTTETRLSEQQAIGLSDVAGSLKEVMLLALRARTDERCARELAEAVGWEGVRGIVEFWGEELEI